MWMPATTGSAIALDRALEAPEAGGPELGEEGLDDLARDRLMRMGHQHAKITELFHSLVDEAQTNVVPPPEETDEGEHR